MQVTVKENITDIYNNAQLNSTANLCNNSKLRREMEIDSKET